MNVQLMIQLVEADDFQMTPNEAANAVLEALGADPNVDRVNANVSYNASGSAGAPQVPIAPGVALGPPA